MAQVAGISQATGSFSHVSPGITEIDSDSSTAKNVFTLQLNSNFVSQSVDCQAGVGAGCVLWEQFLYASNGTSPTDSAPAIYIQYWVLSYGLPCHNIGFVDAGNGNCFENSAAVHLPQLTASDLASVTLTGTVSATDDTVKLTLGSTAYATSGRDLGLYGNWNQTQWGVYGMPPPAGSGEAFFDPMGSALEADTAFVASTGAAPQCVQQTGPPGMTAEYNNLSLSTTAEPPSLGPHPTVASFQVFQIPAPPATAATCVAQPAGVAPSISPAAYSVTHLPAGTSSYSCPSGRLCLQVDDPTTGGTTVFDLYYCKTYALSHWLYWGEYTDNQTGSSTTTYFYGASTSQVLAQFTPTGTQQHTYNWTPVNWIKAC